MGWAEGIRMGGEWYSDYQDRKRQAVEDAWTKKVRARQEQEWANKDAGVEAATRGMADVTNSFANPVDYDPRADLGLPKQGPIRPPTNYGSRPPTDQFYQPAPTATGLPDPVAPAAPTPTPRQPDQREVMLRARLSAAQAAKNPDMFYPAAEELRQHLAKQKYAKIADFVMNADDSTMDQLASKVSLDRQNDYKMTREKDGYFRITMGDASVKLARDQLAQYMAAKARLADGDTTALNDIAGINTALAAKVKDKLTSMNTISTLNNTAQNHADAARAKMITAGAAATNAKTNAEYHGAQVKRMKDEDARREEAAKLADDFAALTPEQQNGPEGIAIQRKFNMLNVKNGGQVQLGLPRGSGAGSAKTVLKLPVDLKQNNDGSYTAFAKDGGTALYNTYNGETLPLGMEVDEYKQLKKQAASLGVRMVLGEDANGRLSYRYVGADGQPYENPEEASKSKPKPAARPAAPAARPTGVPTPTPPASPPWFSRVPAGPNYPGGMLTYTGPDLFNPEPSTLDPRKNFPSAGR